MKLAISRVEGAGNVRKDFSKTNSLVEGIKRRAVVAALLVSATFSVHCGGENPDPDGGHGGDGGTMQTDGGTTGDGGMGGDDGGASLCSMYGEGHPNRTTFGRGEIRVPAQNTAGWLMYFRKIEDIGGAFYTNFGVYAGVSAPTFYGFPENETRNVNVPTVGTVRMQLCDHTSLECSALPGGGSSGTGDPNCRATLAADMPWGL
jgi:hypothetical protein